jgi:surface antigen
MRPSLRASIRHVRPLATVVAIASAAACSDQASITNPTTVSASAAQLGDLDVAPSDAPLGALLPGVSSGSSNGVLIAGGPYNVRTGPGTNYGRAYTANAGTPVQVVCTTTRTSSTTGATTTWARLSATEFNNWISASFIDYDADAGTPRTCDSSTGPTFPAIASGTRGDDYPYKTAAYADCANDPWSFCVRQCTSFVTWRLRSVNKIAFWLVYGGKGWGSAYKWREVAQALGYRVDRTPEVGAVAYWPKTSSRPYGHVAWVSSVSSDGSSVTVEEYNVSPKYGYGKRTLSVSSIGNFIHLY